MSASSPDANEILHRLSAIKGITSRHLPLIRSALSGVPLPEGVPSVEPRGASVVARAIAVIATDEGRRRADELLESCLRKRISRVLFGDADYPEPLISIPGAPLVLFAIGTIPAEWTRAVAVVGSRVPTGPGKAYARELSRDLAERGAVVVSGLARGIDTAAHQGAIDACGVTVAVLGNGVDVAYPPESAPLAEKIAANGVLLSEYPPGTLPAPTHFPARNRIVSGLSRGVVVVEAPERSGALITARFALDQGREVFAVPGNPLFPHTAGSNRLIRDGASPVTSVDDVVSLLGLNEPSGAIDRKILSILARPQSIAEISTSMGIPAEEVLSRLFELELLKRVERMTGDVYKRMP